MPFSGEPIDSSSGHPLDALKQALNPPDAAGIEQAVQAESGEAVVKPDADAERAEYIARNKKKPRSKKKPPATKKAAAQTRAPVYLGRLDLAQRFCCNHVGCVYTGAAEHQVLKHMRLCQKPAPIDRALHALLPLPPSPAPAPTSAPNSAP
jgi:hypothetical protein